jgi:PAS domain S-box-containing protein
MNQSTKKPTPGSRVNSEADRTRPAPQYRQIVETACDGLIVHDRKRVFFANRCFRDMFGLDETKDLSSTDIRSFLPPGALRSYRRALDQAERNGHAPILFEGEAHRQGGEVFHVELGAFSTTYEGRPAYQTVVRDITERKRREQEFVLAERLAATGKIAFDIAHEINNPLGGIVTYTHLLLEDLDENVPKEQIRDEAKKILKLAHRCQIIVGALLDFAREERDSRRETSLNQIVHDTLELLEGHFILKGLDLTLELAEDLPEIMADSDKIGQVLTNLIVNAAEAMDGRGRLTIRTFHDPSHNAVTLQIQDTGPGIPGEIVSRVFEPFFTTKPRGRGTGLGLAISHGIVKQHDGQIRLESGPEGVTFTVSLPNLI